MGRLTTHVLDAARGVPGAGIAIDLYRMEDGERVHIAATETNGDGRCNGPLLEGEGFAAGVYELVFQTAAYFRNSDIELPDPPFLDAVVVRFGVSDTESHYHVPILVSPWSYTTYRGS
ncbi:MAG: hydroxyisourate hydrolase [Alphaproteobacteria bacterium]|nr:hydroxyisourate hydrolase [Alphaproteobacteria bacterium]